MKPIDSTRLPADGPELGAAEGAKVVSDATSDRAHAAQPQVAEAVPRNKGGAPKGAANGRALHLLNSKESARATRDTHRRQAERLVRDALVSAGLGDHPLAKLVGKNLVRLEAGANRCEDRAMQRGYFDRNSNPSAAFKAMVDIVGSMLSEYRRLLEAMTPVGQPREQIIRVQIIEDASAEDGGLPISAADIEAAHQRTERIRAEIGPGKRCDDLTLAAKLARGEITLPEDSPLDETEDATDTTQDARSGPRPPSQRRGARGAAATGGSTTYGAAGSNHAPSPSVPKTLREVFENADDRLRREMDADDQHPAWRRI